MLMVVGQKLDTLGQELVSASAKIFTRLARQTLTPLSMRTCCRSRMTLGSADGSSSLATHVAAARKRNALTRSDRKNFRFT